MNSLTNSSRIADLPSLPYNDLMMEAFYSLLPIVRYQPVRELCHRSLPPVVVQFDYRYLPVERAPAS
jgi:hypothetical protein